MLIYRELKLTQRVLRKKKKLLRIIPTKGHSWLETTAVFTKVWTVPG